MSAQRPVVQFSNVATSVQEPVDGAKMADCMSTVKSRVRKFSSVDMRAEPNVVTALLAPCLVRMLVAIQSVQRRVGRHVHLVWSRVCGGVSMLVARNNVASHVNGLHVTCGARKFCSADTGAVACVGRNAQDCV